MSTRIAPIILILALAIISPLATHASWAPMPTGKHVAARPLIITGKITAIAKEAAKGEDFGLSKRHYDLATITITKILKNKTKSGDLKIGDTVQLLMPSKMVISTDIRFKKGQEGIWFLQPRKTAFSATFPLDYQPSKNLPAIEAQISGKQPTKK